MVKPFTNLWTNCEYNRVHLTQNRFLWLLKGFSEIWKNMSKVILAKKWSKIISFTLLHSMSFCKKLCERIWYCVAWLFDVRSFHLRSRQTNKKKKTSIQADFESVPTLNWFGTIRWTVDLLKLVFYFIYF